MTILFAVMEYTWRYTGLDIKAKADPFGMTKKRDGKSDPLGFRAAELFEDFFDFGVEAFEDCG